MAKAGYDAFSVIDTAMQIIQDEHLHFLNEMLENDEHVARIVRIAESVETLLQSSGRSKREVESDVQRIIRYGRQLFVDEWMRPLSEDDEDDVPDEQDAIKEFEQYVKKHKKSTKQLSGPSKA